MSNICFIVGLLILTISIAFAVKNRHNAKKWIANVMVGIFFATVVMVLPTQWVKQGQEVTFGFGYSLVYSMVYSLKTLAGRPEVAQLETIGLEGALKCVYVVVNYACCILAPIVTTGLLVSFFGDTLQKLRFWLSCAGKCCVFSKLNENSIVLAESIKNSDSHTAIVFCNAKKVDEDLAEKARKLGGILLYKSCTEIKPVRKIPLFPFVFREFEFYLISEDEDDNIKDAQIIVEHRAEYANRLVKVNAFAHSKTSIAVLEQVSQKRIVQAYTELNDKTFEHAASGLSDPYKKYSDVAFLGVEADAASRLLCPGNYDRFKKYLQCGRILTDKHTVDKATFDSRYELCSFNLCVKDKENEWKTEDKQVFGGRVCDTWHSDPFQIRFVDEVALFCNQHILKYPLFDLPEGSKKISVVIAGCGYWGMQMLKTVIWAGQIDGYKLKIRVFDKKIGSKDTGIEKEFNHQCPAVRGIIDRPGSATSVKFIKADFMSDDFENKVLSESSDATYICVATGSDELNLSVSEELFRIFRKNRRFDATPPIFTRVRKSVKNSNYNQNIYLAERNIHLFGVAQSFYANETLFDTQLECLALAVHLVYDSVINENAESVDTRSREYQKAKQKFLESEYNRNSSLALALHIPAKLLMCCGYTAGKDMFFEKADDCSKEYKARYPQVFNMLKRNEHLRWALYMACNGWNAADMDSQVRCYAPKVKNQKDSLTKLHPCIVPWERLVKLSEEYDAFAAENGLKEGKFPEKDESIIKCLPGIITVAKQIYEEENRNVRSKTR